jgi:hypothetical protein
MNRKLSAAQIISFTEKANGVISERNREALHNYSKPLLSTEEEEEDESESN